MGDIVFKPKKIIDRIEFLVEEFIDDSRWQENGSSEGCCKYFKKRLKEYMYEAYEKGLEDGKK